MTSLPQPTALPAPCHGLPSDQQKEVKDAANRIRARLKATVEDIIEIGRDLQTVKKTLGHGKFGTWIEAEFGMSDQTARNFMNVATKFGKSKTVLDFKITQKALYLLAAPSTDNAVVAAAVEKGKAGEKIDEKTVANIKDQNSFMSLKCAWLNASDATKVRFKAWLDTGEAKGVVVPNRQRTKKRAAKKK